MLKAFRFDEEEHKDIIEFILKYTDNRGKKNESDAIRFLMKKGLESINNPLPSPQLHQNLDMDKLKAELLQHVLSSVSYNKPAEPAPIKEYLYIPQTESAVARLSVDSKEKSDLDPNPINPLIANMLANRKK